MRQSIKVKPVGRVNRRNLATTIDDSEVLYRENFYVVGSSKTSNRKFAGSDRLNSVASGTTPIVWGHRYYSKLLNRHTFFFNGGSLQSVDELGNTSSACPQVFSPAAYPCSVQMRVSSNDVLYFSEGVTTGMWSFDDNESFQFKKEIGVTNNFVGMVGFLDRIFAFEEDSEDLYFSKTLDPTNFTDSTDAGVITIGAKRGSKIQQIAIFSETIFIYKNDSVWALLGKTPSEFTVVEIHPTLGLASRRSMAQGANTLFGLMSDYEVYSFTGYRESFTMLTHDLALKGGLTDGNYLSPIMNISLLDQICGTFFDNMYRLSFAETGQVANNLEYIFNTINNTDGFTRDNNVGCYIPYDRYPDSPMLVTGRSDSTGFLMVQNRGQNWDNQASGPSMPIRLQTKFFNLNEARNMRVKKVWLNCGSLSMPDINIRMWKDTRIAQSDSTQDPFNTQGETKGMTNLIKVNSQSEITSRGIPRWNSSKGESISLEINEQSVSRDFELESFEMEVIRKNQKRSKHVSI